LGVAYLDRHWSLQCIDAEAWLTDNACWYERAVFVVCASKRSSVAKMTYRVVIYGLKTLLIVLASPLLEKIVGHGETATQVRLALVAGGFIIGGK
jgi:hypothetical protein